MYAYIYVRMCTLLPSYLDLCILIFVLIGFSSKSESLFTYNQQIDQSWETFYDPSFVPIFTVIQNDELLQSVCENDTFCLYDISVTGNTEIGLSTLNGSKQYDKSVQISYPGMHITTYIKIHDSDPFCCIW